MKDEINERAHNDKYEKVKTPFLRERQNTTNSEQRFSEIKQEIRAISDPKIKIPETEEQWNEFYVLDEYWENRLDEIVGEVAFLKYIMPSGRNGEDLNLEKESFLKTIEDESSTYQPEFTYPELINLDLDQLEAKLKSLKQELKEAASDKHLSSWAQLINRLYQLRTNEELAKIGLLQSIKNRNNKQTFAYAKFIYGEVNDDLYQRANLRYQEMLQKPTPENISTIKERQLNPEEIKTYFEEALSIYGLNQEWQVIISNNTSAVTVKWRGKKQIIIPNKPRTESKVIGLIAHEIERHIRVGENGLQKLGILKGAIGLDRNDSLEEGAAKYLENKTLKELYDLNNEPALPFYVMGMAKAKEGATFREVFLDLCYKQVKLKLKEGLPINEAKKESADQTWTICLRVFRGFSDFSGKGFYFPKDKSYLEGELMINELLGSKYEKLLELGKINANQIPIVWALGLEPDNIKYPYKNAAKIIFEKHFKNK